jgi:HK97 family phage major capsid protein
MATEAEKAAQEVNNGIAELKSKIEGGATKEELTTSVDELKSTLENKVSKEDFNTLKTELNKALEEVETLKENGSMKGKEIDLVSEIKQNKEAIKAARNEDSAVTLKTTVLRAAVNGNQQAVELADIGELAHAKLTAYDIFRRIPVSSSNHNGTIRYYDWDEATKVRAAAMVAEGSAFSESTAAWVTETITLKKVGDTLPVSTEFFEDEAMFAAELNMFLDTNVRIKRNDQIVNGDGTGNNLKGVFTSIDAYVPVASGITDASIYDLMVKVAESITSSGGSKYDVNFSLMNITDINKMKLKKDGNNNYIIPPFVSRDGKQVSGIVVLEENSVPANSMVVGDRRYARIYEGVGIQLSRGLVNNQFNEDLETLKARTRLAFLIRGADKGGFKKVTDISLALTTLATP